MIPLTVFETLDSTNAEALRRIEAGETGRVILLARMQSAGRGRRGAAWASPPGNLHMTLIEPEPGEIAALPFRAGLAVHAALAPLLPPGVALQLKWPNDVLADGAKLAGILIEQALGVAAIGIGVNLIAHPDDTPYPANDLVALGEERVDAEALARSIAENVLDMEGVTAAELHRRWLALAWRLGQPVRVEALSGIFAGLDPSGAMLLNTAVGQERIVAGSVRT